MTSSGSVPNSPYVLTSIIQQSTAPSALPEASTNSQPQTHPQQLEASSNPQEQQQLEKSTNPQEQKDSSPPSEVPQPLLYPSPSSQNYR